jgi:hypothetical protein
LECRENSLQNTDNESELATINWHWSSYFDEDVNPFRWCIPIVDTSLAMNNDELSVGIALGSRIVQHSITSMKSLSFATDPLWLYFKNCESLTDIVDNFMNHRSMSGAYINLSTLYAIMMNHIEENYTKYTPDDINKMTFCIFTNMTFEENNNMWFYGSRYKDDVKTENARVMWLNKYAEIVQKYNDLGMRLYNHTLVPPRIIFWNLRKSSIVPKISINDIDIYINGQTQYMVNEFCKKGLDVLLQMNELAILSKLLSNPRYYISLQLFGNCIQNEM